MGTRSPGASTRMPSKNTTEVAGLHDAGGVKTVVNGIGLTEVSDAEVIAKIGEKTKEVIQLKSSIYTHSILCTYSRSSRNTSLSTVPLREFLFLPLLFL
jgi:hypothetical protein